MVKRTVTSKFTWLEVIKDPWSLPFASFLFLALIFAYGLSSLSQIHQAQSSRASVALEHLLTETDQFFDLLNRNLNSLQSYTRTCDTASIKYMQSLSFDVPGVVNFFWLDLDDQANCSDWYYPRFGLYLFDRQLTNQLSLSEAFFVPDIGRTAIVAARTVGQQKAVGVVIPQSYFEQFLFDDLPTDESMVLIDTRQQTVLAIAGYFPIKLWSSVTTSEPLNAIVEPSFANALRLDQAWSTRYPFIKAVYLAPEPSLSAILQQNRASFILVLIVSFGVALAWLLYRGRIVRSMGYQVKLGIRRGEFIAHFQPVVDMKTQQWIGAEALARWERKGQVVAPPFHFIAAAESSGLIKELTIQIANQVAVYMESIVQIDPEFTVSINLSPNFLDQSTVRAIKTCMARAIHITPSNVRFEITEHGLADVNKVQFSAAVAELKQVGFKLGLDDFGTGQSGLEYFSNITPDFLKVDRRFVNAIDDQSSVDFQLLKTVLQLAQSLELTIIAEGVETESQYLWLVQHGVQFAQGWYYQKAIDEDHFRQSLVSKQVRLT